MGDLRELHVPTTSFDLDSNNHGPFWLRGGTGFVFNNPSQMRLHSGVDLRQLAYLLDTYRNCRQYNDCGTNVMVTMPMTEHFGTVRVAVLAVTKSDGEWM